MAGFLDDYGAGDERRARLIKRTILSVVVLAVLSGLLYYGFHNYRQEQEVKRFFQFLEAHNYQAAYEVWAPTDQDKADYPLHSFMQDWGPPVDVTAVNVLDGESCDNSVIVDIDAGSAGDRKVWVNRNTAALSFPPNDRGCVQALMDGEGHLFYQSRHNRVYEWLRNVKYRLHGRTYK